MVWRRGDLGRTRRSFRYAGQGLYTLLAREPNARFHLAATAVALVVGWLTQLERWEWAALLLAMGAVWVAEALNTALELALNVLHPQHHPGIGLAKDVAAAAVLLAAATAVGVGLVVWGPRLLGWLWATFGA